MNDDAGKTLPDLLERWGDFCHWPNAHAPKPRPAAERVKLQTMAARDASDRRFVVDWRPGDPGICPVKLREKFGLCRRCGVEPRKPGRDRGVACTEAARDRARIARESAGARA